MHSPQKKIVRQVLFALVWILAIFYFLEKGPEFKKLVDLSLRQIILASGVMLVSYCINAQKFRTIFQAFKIHLSLFEWLGISQVMRMGNMIFFKSGTVTVAYFLKSFHQLSYSTFIVALTAEKILDLYMIVGMMLLYSLGLFFFQDLDFGFVVLSGIFFSGLNYFLFKPISWKLKWTSRPFQLIQKTLDTWKDFQKTTRAITLILFWKILHMVSVGGRLYIAFIMLNQPITFFECVVISGAIRLAGWVGIVPGNLGIREVTVGLTASFLGNNFDHGLFAATIDRILETIWTFLLGMFYYHYLSMKKYKQGTEIATD